MSKYKIIEECIWALKQSGYTLDDPVYRAMVVERALLEKTGKSPVKPLIVCKTRIKNPLGL